MLSDFEHSAARVGTPGIEVDLPATFLQELLVFIANELPRWRDRPERPLETSEDSLSSQLCSHLASVTRHAKGWDILQFRREEPDQHARNRSIDLAVAPCGSTIWIDGLRYFDFDTLLPIECKRLPTPRGSRRDQREYVFSDRSTTGGIQRFKESHHGARYKLAAMIGYVQKETCAFWHVRIGEWVEGLVALGQAGWTAEDLLHLDHYDANRRVAVLSSTHSRSCSSGSIDLRHLWIQMN